MIDGAIRVYGKYTFPDEAHERLRIAILRSRYRVKAVYACTRDRHAWRESVRLYRQAGGSPAPSARDAVVWPGRAAARGRRGGAPAAEGGQVPGRLACRRMRRP